MEKKSFLFLAVVFSLLLAGCNNVDNTSSENSSTTSVGGSSSSSSEVNVNPPSFLLGKFYAPTGILTVNEKEAVLDDLTLSYIDYDEAEEILYLENFNGGDAYRLYLSNSEKMEVILDIQNGENFEIIDTFMPDITQFVGTYTAYGDSSPYNIPIVITDEYVSDLDTFTVNQPLYSYGSYDNDYYYASTYFAYIDGELKTMIDILDYEDDYLYYSCYLTINNGIASLYDVLYDSEAYYADLSFVYGTYFVDDNKTLSFEYSPVYDENTWEYSINSELMIDGESFNIELIYDNGSYLKIYNDSREALLQSTAYGLKWIENNKINYYPYNTLEHLVGTYKNEVGFVYSFQLDNANLIDGTLLINNQQNEFEVVIFEDKLGISTHVDGYNENVVFIEFKTNISVEMYANESFSYLINYDAFLEAFQRTYFQIVYTSNGSIVHFYNVDSNLTLSSNNQTFEGYFKYNPREDYPKLVYSDWSISVIDYENKIFAMTNNIDGKIKYLFDISFFDNLDNKDYTNGKEKISFIYDNEKINLDYKNENLSFVLIPIYDAYSFSYLIAVDFELAGEYLELIYSEGWQWTEYILENEQYIANDSYIPLDTFNKLVGVYKYEGQYGVEGFELTSDGHFYADTLNEKGDGLIYHQEMEYQLQMYPLGNGEVSPVISFYYDGMWINCYFEDYSLLVVETRYVREELFNYSGIYVDSTNTSIIAIYQNKIMINGVEALINNIKIVDDTLNIEVTINGEISTIILSTVDGVKKITYNDIELILNDVNYSSFVGTYTDESGNTYTFDNHYGLGGIINGFELTYTSVSSGLPTVYTDFTVILMNGHITLKFSGISETYYLEMTDTGVIASLESSIPLPPPPPPVG